MFCRIRPAGGSFRLATVFSKTCYSSASSDFILTRGCTVGTSSCSVADHHVPNLAHKPGTNPASTWVLAKYYFCANAAFRCNPVA